MDDALAASQASLASAQAEIARRDARIRQLEEFAKKSEVARTKETYEKIVKDVKKDRDQVRQETSERIKLRALYRYWHSPKSVAPAGSTGTNGDGDLIPMTRAQIEYSERKYMKLKEDSRQLRLQNAVLNAKVAADHPSNQQIAIQWNHLRDQVRQLSLERFNEVKSPDTLSEEDGRTLENLSIHYRTFLSTDRMPCYLFRSLIWRLLSDHLFLNFSLVWGPEVCDHLSTMGNDLWKPDKISQVEFQGWRMHTARLIYKSYEIDEPTVDIIATKIHDTMVRFASGDTLKLHGNIREIVRLAAEMSSTFARTKVIPLMTNEPRSALTHGFQCNANTMNEAGQVIKDGKVSLMITPCLLERDGDDYALMVKADVIS
ncbi:hypothetical protein PG995_008302 [Apiospora arundinis]